ncbi:MAG: hypothetical protein IPO61_02530 [Gammaproteobacteria bacterium]|nr:hypothetical protein [Gammaproteobacteria bacterium]
MRGILDVPNQRSSHRQPTPTGGGLGIIVGTLVAMATAWWFTDVGADWLLALLLSLLLGLLGFVDDRVHLGVGVRIVCQVCAALAVVTFGMLQYAGTGVQMRPGLLLLVPGVLYLVWMTNLFNFMDGIDGLAGTQAIFVAAGRGVAREPGWRCSRLGAAVRRGRGCGCRLPVLQLAAGAPCSWAIPAACFSVSCWRRVRC